MRVVRRRSLRLRTAGFGVAFGWALIALVSATTLGASPIVPAHAVQSDQEPADPKQPKPGGDGKGEPKPEEKPQPAPAPTLRGKVEFHPFGHACRQSSESFRPLIAVFPGPPVEGEASAWAPIEKSLIARNEKRMAKFIVAEIGKPSDTQVIERFGGVTERMVAICDFRGVVLKRWDGELPSRGAFRKALNKAWSANALLAGKFAKATKEIGKARYALKTKKYKQSVAHYLVVEKLALPSESKVAKDHAKLRNDYDKKIDERKKKANELEKKNDLIGAINLLEKTMQEFPLPDVKDNLRKRVTELYRKMRGYGG